jgi:hypothetical protein
MKLIHTKSAGVLLALISICAVCVGQLLADELPWKLIRESDGIQVYSRMEEGSQIVSFKGVSREKVGIDAIASILLDIAAYPSWIEYIKESKIIKRIDDDNFYVYQRFDFFRPFHDRDIVVKVSIKRFYKEGYLHATMEAVKEDLYPLQNKCVRMKDMTGEITVRYVSPEITEGHFQEQFSPGGHVPDWITKKINEYIPLVVLKELKKEAAKRDTVDKSDIRGAMEKAQQSVK